MVGGKGMLDLDSFVADQLKLLQLEREAEIAEASASLPFVGQSTFKSEGTYLI